MCIRDRQKTVRRAIIAIPQFNSKLNSLFLPCVSNDKYFGIKEQAKKVEKIA